MRHHLARAAALAVALFVASPAVAASAGKNLLANPDFETSLADHPWMPTGWDTSEVSFVTSVFFGRDTFLVEHGSYAVSVANVSALYPIGHNWSQAVVVGPEAWGKDAVFSVWTRSIGVEGRGFVTLQAYKDTVTKMSRIWGLPREEASDKLGIKKVADPLIDLGWRRQYFSDPETGWVKRTVRVFVPPSVNVLWVRLGLNGTGQVMFDDASLTLEPAKRPDPVALDTNLLKDPGFEGNGDDWEYSLPPYLGIRVFPDTTVKYSGRASIHIESGLDGLVQARTGVGQAFPDRQLAAKRVRLSARIKTDSLAGLANLNIYAHTPRGGFSAVVPKQYSFTNDWELTTQEMDLPADTYEVWVWFAFSAPATGRVYFDDCRFEVLGPARAPSKPWDKALH
jgi:hypothetical protein